MSKAKTISQSIEGVLKQIRDEDEALKRREFERELEKDHVRRAELAAEKARLEEKKRMDTSEGAKQELNLGL